MPKPVEVDGLELILKNSYNLFLEKINKMGKKIYNLGENLII